MKNKITERGQGIANKSEQKECRGGNINIYQSKKNSMQKH